MECITHQTLLPTVDLALTHWGMSFWDFSVLSANKTLVSDPLSPVSHESDRHGFGLFRHVSQNVFGQIGIWEAALMPVFAVCQGILSRWGGHCHWWVQLSGCTWPVNGNWWLIPIKKLPHECYNPMLPSGTMHCDQMINVFHFTVVSFCHIWVRTCLMSLVFYYMTCFFSFNICSLSRNLNKIIGASRKNVWITSQP